MLRLLAHLRRTLWRSLTNDILVMSKAAAYSAILTVFPALLVLAALMAITPQAEFLRMETRHLLFRMFPPDVPPVLMTYFQG